MSEKITLPGALRWMRDQFGNWLASVTVFSFLWIAVAIAVTVLFVWDGVWSRHQAPSNLDPLTFQGAGWVMRLWTVFALAGAVWCFRHHAKVAGMIMSATWVLTSLMTYGHALGFIATGQQERYATASAVVNVEEVAVSSGADQIAALEAQRATIREDRDKEMERLAALISEVQTNRVASDDHLAEVYANESASVSSAARDRLTAIDAQIMDVHGTKQEARTTGATETASVIKFDPLYILLAEWTDGKPGVPDDEYIRKIAQGIGAFWAALLEMIGGAGPALLYAIHAHAADKKRDGIAEEYSDDVPEGKRRVEFTEQEWEEWQDAYERHKKRKRAAEDKAPPGSPLRLDNKEWKRKIKQGFQDALDEGLSPQEIADKFGFAWPEYENLVRRFFNKTAQAKYLGQPADSEPDPRAATPPVPEADEPPEAEADDQAEYPVDFPRNEKPNGEDHDAPHQ